MNTLTNVKESIHYLTNRCDFNVRPDHIIQMVSEVNTQRIIAIAFPFLSLHSKTAPIASQLTRAYQLYVIWNSESDSKIRQTALLLGSIALSTIFPPGQLIFSSLVFFAQRAYQLSQDENRKETTYQIVSQIVHLASMYYGTPKWVVLSLLSQAASEAYKGFTEQRTPEKIAAFVMAGIRGYKAYTLIPHDFALTKVKKVKAEKPAPVKGTPPRNTLLDCKKGELLGNPTSSPAPEPVSPSSLDPEDPEKPPKQLTQEDWDKLRLKLPSQVISREHDFALTKVKKVEAEKSAPVKGTPPRNTLLDCKKGELLGNPTSSPAPEPVSPSSLAPGDPEKPPKQLTQEDWDKLRLKLPSQVISREIEYFDIAALLKREGFSTELTGLNIDDISFYNCIFEGIKFSDCNFKYATFSNCKFKQVTAEHCRFNESRWKIPVIYDSIFTNCDFAKSYFYNSIERSYNERAPLDPKTQNINFQDVEFQSCNFRKTEFRFLRMDGVKALTSSFQKSYFYHLSVENAFFTSCDFSLSSIIRSFYKKTSLIKCDLQQSNWTQTSLDQVTIEEGALSESSFLQAPVKNSQLINCDLKDAMLLDAKEGFSIQGGTPHQITKPIVALGWHFDEIGSYTYLIRQALRDSGALVLQYEQSTLGGYRFAESPLSAEVIATLEKLPHSEQSIGEQLLQTAPANSEIDKLKKVAQEILKYATGLIIPGGEDIEPFFYNRSKKPDKFEYRTILELALLSEASRRKVPTMGICRGAQMINVFFGGTLLNVEDQSGTHPLQWTKAAQAKKLRTMLSEKFSAVSAHHQAVDQVGKGLHVVLKLGTVPKLLLSEDGNFIASQVHPEVYIETIETLVGKIDKEGKGFTEQDLAITKKISTDIQTKIQEMHDQYLDSPFAKRFLERAYEKFSKVTRHVDFIFNNKNIYRFFLNKVEKLKQCSLQSPVEAG